MSKLIERIDAAIERITSGAGAMRIPADETDPDLVLAACKVEIERMRELLRRIEKYAREDRAVTPGVTRLARALDEVRAALERG